MWKIKSIPEPFLGMPVIGRPSTLEKTEYIFCPISAWKKWFYETNGLIYCSSIAPTDV